MTNGPMDPFATFRGGFPAKALTARRVAGLLDVPGCDRRAVLDAAGIDLEKLAVLLGGRRDRQSPFAITRGNQFETQATGDHWAPIIALVREHLGFEIPEVRTLDLSSAEIREQFQLNNQGTVQARRAAMTRTAVADMLAGDEEAYNLIRHPLTSLQIGGQIAWLEQDVLAFSVNGNLFVIEIKSFPSIDGRPDPEKVSTALRQTAVYLLSMQSLAAELGFCADRVSTRVLLVLPRNLSFTPVGKVQDVAMQVARLRRQIEAVPDVAGILDGLAPGVSLPELPGRDDPAETLEEARAVARDALGAISPRFGDGCAACPLFAECRSEAERFGLITRLGNEMANTCGSVATVDEALALAEGRRAPHGEAEQALTAVLSQGVAAAELFGMAG